MCQGLRMESAPHLHSATARGAVQEQSLLCAAHPELQLTQALQTD